MEFISLLREIAALLLLQVDNKMCTEATSLQSVR